MAAKKLSKKPASKRKKEKAAKPISDNPGASLALVGRARRRSGRR